MNSCRLQVNDYDDMRKSEIIMKQLYHRYLVSIGQVFYTCVHRYSSKVYFSILNIMYVVGKYNISNCLYFISSDP